MNRRAYKLLLVGLILLASVLLGLLVWIHVSSEETNLQTEWEQDLEDEFSGQQEEVLQEDESEALAAVEPEPEPELEPESEPEIEEESEESQRVGIQAWPTIGNFFAEDGLRIRSQEFYYSIYFFEEGLWLYNGDSGPMPAASVIKVYIMRYVYSLMESGDIASDTIIAGQSVGQLIRAMIQWSDNDATNVLIDYFGMESINQYLAQQGYTDTLLQRRMLDFVAREQGLDNLTSTRDAMTFLYRLYTHREVFPYNEMLDIMLGQRIHTKIPLLLPGNVAVANKTGELEDVENDMGIVFGQDGAFAIVVLSRGVNYTDGMRRGIGLLALEALEFMVALGQE